jgi:hypothetical protein
MWDPGLALVGLRQPKYYTRDIRAFSFVLEVICKASSAAEEQSISLTEALEDGQYDGFTISTI